MRTLRFGRNAKFVSITDQKNNALFGRTWNEVDYGSFASQPKRMGYPAANLRTLDIKTF